MIRRALLIGAALTLPAAGLSAVALGVGVAGAAHSPPVAVSCATSGSVTFPKPGLNTNGSTTTKTTETSKASFASNVGDPTACSTKAIKLKITSATTPCSQMSPTPPSSCTAVKAKPNYYDTTSGFASSSTTTDIYNALVAKPLKTKDNGDTLILNAPPSSSDVTQVVGGACGAGNVGFQIANGVVTDATNTVHTWNSLTCINGDSGTGTTGNFEADFLASAGGNSAITISGATFGGNSALSIS